MKDWRNSDKEFFTSRDVSKILDLPREYVRAYFTTGIIKSLRGGTGKKAAYLVKKEDLIEFLDNPKERFKETSSDEDKIKKQPVKDPSSSLPPPSSYSHKTQQQLYGITIHLPFDLISKIDDKRIQIMPMPARSKFIRKILEEAMS